MYFTCNTIFIWKNKKLRYTLTTGGAAHAFVTKEGYHFEVGPSLYSGMNPDASSTPKEANPLGLVLKAIGEPLDLIKYDTWNVIIPEGTFLTRVGAEDFENLLQKVPLGGAAAVQEWRAFREFMRPWSRASTMICPLNLRNDPGAAVTAVARNFLAIAQELPRVNGLVQPFSKLLDQAQVQNKFIRRWLDLLSFLLSGLPANGTIAAEMGFMLNEFYRPNAYLDFPRGGAMAMVDALARGVTKKGGKVLLSSHVEEILLDDAGRACGVRLRGGDVIHATKAVISNCAIVRIYICTDAPSSTTPSPTPLNIFLFYRSEASRTFKRTRLLSLKKYVLLLYPTTPTIRSGTPTSSSSLSSEPSSLPPPPPPYPPGRARSARFPPCGRSCTSTWDSTPRAFRPASRFTTSSWTDGRTSTGTRPSPTSRTSS